MLRQIQVNLDRGQLDQRLAARSDLAAYRNGLMLAENWRPLAQGGVKVREQFVSKASANPPTGAVRMIEWEFDEDEQYIVAIAPTKLYFYRMLQTYDLQYISTVDMIPFWVSVNETDIRKMQYAQRFDTMIIAQRAIKPIIITRTDIDNFIVNHFEFGTRGGQLSEQPTFRFTTAAITMQPCDVAGAAIQEVNAGDSLYVQWAGVEPATGLAYDPDNIEVGAIVRYHNSLLVVTAEADVNDRVAVTAQQDLPRTRRVYVDYDDTNSTVAWLRYETVLCTQDNGEGVVVNWGVWGGDNYIDIVVQRGEFTTSGSPIIGAESGMTMVIAESGHAWVSHAYSPWWSESLYSDYRGWFSAVAFFQQRLWIGGSWDGPAMLNASQIQDYFSFNLGTGGDADSIQVQLAANNPGMIQCLKGARHLQIHTELSEHYVAEDVDTPITPDTISIRAASEYGKGTASPVAFGGDIYFSDKSNRQLRAYGWNDIEQAYQAVPVAFSHEDLLTDITELNVQYSAAGESAEFIYILNSGGTLVLMFNVDTVQPPIRGFWKWTMANGIDSLAVLLNELYVLSNDDIYRLTPNTLHEEDAKLKTTVLTWEDSEVSTRGRHIRQGKVEIDALNLATLTINGRDRVNAQSDGDRIDHWMMGWTREPQIEITIPAGEDGTILSILQEVSM